MKQVFRNEIQRHVYSIPALVSDVIENTFVLCDAQLKRCVSPKCRKIVLTGCGYSYAAALAVRDALADITHLPVLVVPAVELARFTNAGAGALQNTVLFAISGSGAVSRVLEAMALYKRLGACVIGVTGNLHGPIERYADGLLDIRTPEIGSTLPLRGYAMTILSLLAAGWTIAALRGIEGTISRDQILAELRHDMAQLQNTLPELDRGTMQFVAGHPSLRAYEFVGSGYERAAAFLGKIEMMGQAGCMASDEDAEQWCHCNFFMADPEHIGTVLFYASRSPAASRTREVLQYMQQLQRPVCVLTDARELASDANMQVFHLPEITAWNAGLLEMTVPSFLAGYVCEALGETYSRGFCGRWAMFQNGCSTCESEMLYQ